MQADPAAQALLLQIADIDTQTRQATTRKRTLPEHEQLADLNQRRQQQGEQQVVVRTRVEDAETALERVEADLAPAKARLTRNEQRLDDGLVSDPRSIKATQDEIAHLKERIDNLEEQELEIMQRIEDENARLAELVATRSAIEDEMRTLLASRNATVAEIDQALQTYATQRAALVAKMPTDLMALYHKIAERLDTGAALLKARRCTGCGLLLDASAMARIVAAVPAEVVRCEECGRILVRTAESGL
ncbi:MAG: C4-type zinc ribbon domain-containing protein [Propionibacteriaceae bacterium]|jgi:predicted  nucleic acid-binding Zn-ribbon protein|nr:C4-type zinc ribbon domain-containing protein [Propionibacteriaceae bacterium]